MPKGEFAPWIDDVSTWMEMEGQLDKPTSYDDDFSLHSPKKQGQLRDEASTTSVARTCRWSLERLDECWECLEIFQGQHVGQSNVHSVDLDVALAQTPCLSIGVGPYVNQAGFASLHVHVRRC